MLRWTEGREGNAGLSVCSNADQLFLIWHYQETPDVFVAGVDTLKIESIELQLQCRQPKPSISAENPPKNNRRTC
jgi:ubiquinone biosynthesis protein Coq4